MPFVFQPDADGYQNPAQSKVPFQTVGETPKLTDADLLASSEPLSSLLPLSARKPSLRAEALRILGIQRSALLAPGEPWDETDPAGRAALLDEINARCGLPPE